ncbi:HNH endonuclease [Nocardia uniformis]|uniref:HNH endonuclease n=1 Tax=Nocardia uniformis TaxID=53432 RepID=A0A849C8A3_9NOCA|nr:HNH endonuclease [Nocardia uniformis]NNH72600.1 HNH endonuclease [Nocardia uniformis]
MARNPAWTRDELILACDLVFQNGGRELREHDLAVTELSDLLRSLPIHPRTARDQKFRSPNSVSRKTTDIATHYPGYLGKKTRGGKLDRVVLDDFLAAPVEMHAAAELIRRSVSAGQFDADVPLGDAPVEDSGSVREGRLLEALHYRRERNPKARSKKIIEFRRVHGRVSCEVCAFDFEAVYGERGNGYIECHHVVPLHASGETSTRSSDLILLCSNCHRMIHRGPRWLQPGELRGLLQASKRRA